MIQIDDNFIKEAVQAELKTQIEKYIKSAEFRKIVDTNIKTEMSHWWNVDKVAAIAKEVFTKDGAYVKNLGETVSGKLFSNIVDALVRDGNDYDY